MTICPSCSTRNADDAAYCIGCGMRLAVPPSATAAGAPEGLAAPAHAALSPGALVDGKYSVVRVLGEGGMGIVYLAHDVHTDVNVVLKSIRSEFSHNEDFRQRILAEGRVLARIDHPNVVRLNAIVVERGTLYLVMQYIEGESLDALIARHTSARTAVPFPHALGIFRQILEGVGAAHREGIIHRDLKPANILVRSRDAVAKVTDFGIAKAESDALAGRGRTQGIIGSLWYMAPEQLQGRRDLDKRVDIYALGILFFELLTGRVPFDAPSDYELMRLHTEAPLPSVCALRPDVPRWIDDLLARACAKDRHARFASCDEMLAALSTYEAGAPGHAPGANVPGAGAFGRASTAPAPPGWSPPRDGIGPAEHAVGTDGSATSRRPGAVLPRRRAALVGGAIALAAAGAALSLYFGGAFDEEAPPSQGGRAAAPGTSPSAIGSDRGAAAATTSAPPAGASRGAQGAVGPARAAGSLAPLVGRWRSDTNRDYDAVLSGNVLEFRIVDASQYPRQGYRDGDARFTLTAVRGQERVFGVEDHIRPVPPKGVEYDETRARPSCQEVWSSLGGQPLRAEFDGSRLTVDLVKLETRVDRFEIERDKVVACRGLREGTTSKIESVLVRVGG